MFLQVGHDGLLPAAGAEDELLTVTPTVSDSSGHIYLGTLVDPMVSMVSGTISGECACECVCDAVGALPKTACYEVFG
jgi:hypothetical protein